MPKQRDTSEASAARFLRLRQASEERLAKLTYEALEKAPPPMTDRRSPAGRDVTPKPRIRRAPIPGVPEGWQYVERHFRGAYAAWVAGPNGSLEDFRVGITGSPRYAVATGAGWYVDGHPERRAFVFFEDRWIERPASAEARSA